ncbi:DUF6489 family protein [uncultured Thiodictyon sp.]|uniref:DUF6489 family protein n=1 Tax=uncultured Thiodictyon sp. TaxID=1846217 RepID=UPI0025D0B4CB|nr:DUF6489 family protein [uncultured Thiodictyon sp.]
MKITVNFDITPEEMRKLFGLPDVEAFQRQLMDDIRERMMTGAEGYDPVKLFQPYMAGTMASWDMFQKFLGGAMSHPKSADDTHGEGKK